MCLHLGPFGCMMTEWMRRSLQHLGVLPLSAFYIKPRSSFTLCMLRVAAERWVPFPCGPGNLHTVSCCRSTLPSATGLLFTCVPSAQQ